MLFRSESFNAAGWFLTGDLGWIDERGCLHVTGRKKDIIVRGGHKIYPARIEALASRHAAIDKVVALPAPDERLGEKVCLAVTLRSGQTLDAEAMLEHLDAAGLSKFDMPEFFIAMDAFPLTASGKILKRELVEWVRAGRIAPAPCRWVDPKKRA